MSDVFISYSRTDREFVGKLREALASEGQDVWIDWESIPASQAWWAEIKKGILSANNFVLILSPNSMASPICHMELEYARELGKRIIPVLYMDYQREPAITDIAKRLADPDQDATRQLWATRQPHDIYDANERDIQTINYFFFRPDDDFDARFAALMEVIFTDYAYKEQHTTLELRALEWERRNRDASFLLLDTELEQAQTWLESADGKLPAPTKLHVAYIEASAKRTRQLKNIRRTSIVGSALAAIAIAFAIGATLIGTRAVNSANNDLATVTVQQGAAEANANQAATQAADAGHLAATATFQQGQAEDSAATAQAQATIAQDNANQAVTQAADAGNLAATATVQQGQAEDSAATAQAQATIAQDSANQAQDSAATATIQQGQAEAQAATAENLAATATAQQGIAEARAEEVVQTLVAATPTLEALATSIAFSQLRAALIAKRDAISQSLAGGRPDAALAAADDFVEEYPDEPEAYITRSNLYYRLGNLQAALEDINRAIDLIPDRVELLINRALIHEGLGDTEAALDDYDTLITALPDYAIAYSNRGTLYEGQGNYEAAIADFTQAIDIDPMTLDAYYERAGVYVRLQQYEAALADFTTLLEISPTYVDAYQDRALVYLRLEDLEAALMDVNAALALTPQNARLYNLQGSLYRQLGQPENALNSYDTAIQLDPTLAESYYNRGNLYTDLGDSQNALRDFSLAITLNPDIFEPYQGRGLIYLGGWIDYISSGFDSIPADQQSLAQANLAAAIADFSSAIAIDPNQPQPYFARAIAYTIVRDCAAAQADWQTLEILLGSIPENWVNVQAVCG